MVCCKNILKKVTIFFCAFLCCNSSFSQGSKTTLNFDGTNDHFIGNAGDLNAITNNFTIEFWFNASATITIKAQQNGVSDISGTTGNGQRYLIYPSHGGGANGAFGNAGVGVSVGTNAIQVYEHKASYMPCLLSYNGSLIVAGWNHVAIVYTAKQPSLYVNGVFAKTGITSNQTNVFPSCQVGGFSYGWYAGDIDELRIWSSIRNVTEIRDNMCKKLLGSEANLVRYYRMDDGAGTTTTDATGTQNGTLINMTPATDWITSGAPVGDNSVNSYPGGGWSGATLLTLTNPLGQDALRVSNMTGTPTGVHIYGVSQAPNVTCGAVGVGSNDRYFGVFVVGGTAPSFTARYDYSNTPSVNAINEPNLDLAKRATNSNTACNSWANISATLNMPSNFLTKTGVTGRNELILTSETTPLPVELLSFEAKQNGKEVILDWSTLSEINNDYFLIEKSLTGSDWDVVNQVKGNGNSNSLINYRSIDNNPSFGLSYYRLKQIDYNGVFEYSRIQTVLYNSNSFSFFPNPIKNEVTLISEDLNFNELIFTNCLGQSLKYLLTEINSNQNNLKINTRSLPSGVYFLSFQNKTIKIIKD